MKRNMKQWFREMIAADVKTPMPVLSFPAVQLMGVSVRELISDAVCRPRACAAWRSACIPPAAVSLMDLSVEAECFGAQVRVSDDEVPTVVGCTVADAQAAEALQIPEVGAGRTGLYVEAIRRACETIADRPVLAGVIGPYSLGGSPDGRDRDHVRLL